MPKAIVAQMTTPSSCRKASWLCDAHDSVEAGVIGQRASAVAENSSRQLLGAPARGAIDDAALAGMRVEPFDELARRVGLRPHREKQVGPVERAHEHARASRRTAARRCRRASARRRSPSPRSSADARAPRRPRAGADIPGGSRGPIARRNAPRRWRDRRSDSASSVSSVSSRSSRSGAT